MAGPNIANSARKTCFSALNTVTNDRLLFGLKGAVSEFELN
jgi:hypothetical protein